MITRIKCPVCKSTDTHIINIDLEEDNIASQHICMDCDHHWAEIDLTLTNERLGADIGYLKQKLTQTQNAYHDLSDQLTAAQKEIDELDQENYDIAAELPAITHLLDQLTAAQKEIDELDQENHALTLTNERLGADIDYLKQKLTQTQNAYHDLSDQLTAAQKEIDELDQENHDLAAQLTQLRETYLYPLNNYLPILVDALGTARPQVLDQAVRHFYQHLHQTGDIQRYEIEIIYFDDEPNTEYANHLETAKNIIEQRETDEGIDTITVYDRKYKHYINPITGEPK